MAGSAGRPAQRCGALHCALQSFAANACCLMRRSCASLWLQENSRRSSRALNSPIPASLRCQSLITVTNLYIAPGFWQRDVELHVCRNAPVISLLRAPADTCGRLQGSPRGSASEKGLLLPEVTPRPMPEAAPACCGLASKSRQRA